MNNLTKIFEGQEVSVKTDKGVTLINLVHVAKCCGLVEKKNSKEYVNWKQAGGIVYKLKKIVSENLPKDIKAEIQYILEEIENTDDRNLIYMSSWLSKRLAVECHSEKASDFKNWLVTLDEARENNQLVVNNAVDKETVLQLAQGMQMIGTVVQGMQTALVNIQTYVKDSIQSKDLQIEKTMDLIGLRSVNTKRLTDKLKEKLYEELGMCVSASSQVYIRAKMKIFKQYDVTKWEDIPVNKYNNVFAFIDSLDKRELLN